MWLSNREAHVNGNKHKQKVLGRARAIRLRTEPSQQLCASILQSPVPDVVAQLAALEGVANPGCECVEWEARAFLSPGDLPCRFAAVGIQFDSLACRSHMPSCRHMIGATATALASAASSVLRSTTSALETRLATLLEAVDAELRPRLRFGAAVTIRRTIGRHDVRTKNGKHLDVAAASGQAKHPDAAIHCDSWDGTMLCFGLISTKLGTPVYPDAVFPAPVQMFASQSRTVSHALLRPRLAPYSIPPSPLF